MSGPLPIRLYTPYYHDDHPARRAELEQCIARNVALPAFERIVLFVDQLAPFAHLASARVELVQTPGRMPTYNDFLAHAGRSAEPFVLVIANTDIHFDPTIERVREISTAPDQAWCLSRREGPCEREPLYTEHYQSSDAWVLPAPPRMIRDTVQLGKLGCESLFLYNLAQAGYTLRNVGIDIPCYHLHASGKRNYDAQRDRYPDQERMAFPILGALPRSRFRARDKILIDSSVFAYGQLGPIRLWLSFLDQLRQSALAPRLVLLQQHELTRSLPFPNRLIGAPFNPFLPLSGAEMIEGFCDKADACLFISTGYQRAAAVPTLNWIYDIRERLLHTGLEGAMQKALALTQARALLYFNSRVKAATEAAMPRLASAASEVIAPAALGCVRPMRGETAARRLQQLGVQRPYLLFIGERRGRGNYGSADELLQAAAALPEPCDIVFVGGAPQVEPEILQTGMARERIHLFAADDDTLSVLLSGALACVEPQRAPGPALSRLDAMACGCPLLVRSSASIPELDEHVALQLPTLNTETLQYCLDAVRRPDVRATMQQAGAARAAARTWHDAGGELCAYVERLAVR